MDVGRASFLAALATYPLLGVLLFWPAGTLDWAAGWSFYAAFVAACVLLTVLEERTLARELSGYEEYARRVRYRLIPFVW